MLLSGSFVNSNFYFKKLQALFFVVSDLKQPKQERVFLSEALRDSFLSYMLLNHVVFDVFNTRLWCTHCPLYITTEITLKQFICFCGWMLNLILRDWILTWHILQELTLTSSDNDKIIRIQLWHVLWRHENVLIRHFSWIEECNIKCEGKVLLF